MLFKCKISQMNQLIIGYVLTKFDHYMILSQKELTQVFYKEAVLKNVANFTRKHLCCNLFSIK